MPRGRRRGSQSTPSAGDAPPQEEEPPPTQVTPPGPPVEQSRPPTITATSTQQVIQQEQQPPRLAELTPGTKVFHAVLRVHGVITKIPAFGDFLHQGKVCMQFPAIEKKVTVVKTRWCSPVELELTRSAATDASTTPQQSARKRAIEELGLAVDEELIEGAQDRPELAEHERVRKMEMKLQRGGTSQSWGLMGSRKTVESLVSIEDRVKAFPDQSFSVAPSPTGKVLFCQCCPKKITNILGTIKTHIASERHQERLKNWLARGQSDKRVAQFVHEYFEANPQEKEASVDAELHIYRWRVVESFLYAGIALDKISHLRMLLERSGVGLTAASHLRSYVPKIEMCELQTITSELKGQSVCVIFDGTSRLGECTAVLMRWCAADFEIHQRLVALKTVKKHMSGDSLGPFLIDVIGQLGLRSSSIVCLARDSCATNGKASRNISPILSQAENMMCISHTLSHCAEHCDLPVLKEFMTPWLGLVQNHPTAKHMWREIVGGSMKGFSNIRWFSREEVVNQLAENYASLPDFVDSLLRDEIGDAHPQKMKQILTTRSDELEVEVACNLDMKPILQACYSLEGDGLPLLLARRKLDSLLSWGDAIGSTPSTLPNVAAVLRKRIAIVPGTKVYEYFTDIPRPAWFTGVVVAPRVEGKFTVKYSDNSKIEQEDHELRQWLDLRENDEWLRIAAAARAGITYLRNRMTGNLPANQIHYDCAHMFEVLHAVQAFDPSWAKDNLTSDSVSSLAVIRPLKDHIQELHQDMHAYLAAAARVSIDHTESAEDHSFTNQILQFYREKGSDFPHWAAAARKVFAFTPNSAGAERVFSLLACMFGDNQESTLGDYIQAAIMLRYNKRSVG